MSDKELEERHPWLLFWAWVIIMAVYGLSWLISIPFADRGGR